MINYYKRLGINKSSSSQEIQEAIDRSSLNGVLKSDAKHVLLNANRKRVYDRCNDCLNLVGSLRSKLEIRNPHFWNKSHYAEYTLENQQRTQPKYYEDNSFKASQSKPKKEYKTKKETEVNNPFGSFKNFITIIMSVLVLGICTVTIFDSDTTDSNSNRNNPSSNYKRPERVFNKPPEALPISGTYNNYTSRPALAPLEVKVPYGDYHYFIKLVDTRSEMTAFTLFVRGGSVEEVNVPLGNYYFRYATGKDWYGYNELFGPGDMTSKFQAGGVFNFSGNTFNYTGHTIELIQQVGGNLQTRKVTDDNW